MVKNFTLESSQCALLIVDVQEKLFAKVDRGCEVAQTIYKAIRGCQILDIPIVVSEQYPKGLGPTLEIIKQALPEDHVYFEKNSFSCCRNELLYAHMHGLNRDQWIVVGLEAHICVQQAAKDLHKFGKEVVVLNDAITSRSIFDYSTAIAEMRDCGIRISSLETVLFELLRSAESPQFRQISQLVK